MSIFCQIILVLHRLFRFLKYHFLEQKRNKDRISVAAKLNRYGSYVSKQRIALKSLAESFSYIANDKYFFSYKALLHVIFITSIVLE